MRVLSRPAPEPHARGVPSGTVIVHEAGDEEGREAKRLKRETTVPAPRPRSQPPSAIPRVRQTKQPQYRPGVGRPMSAGATRAPTSARTLSTQKRAYGKSSNVKSIEGAIQEEEEDLSPPIAGPSGTSHESDAAGSGAEAERNPTPPSLPPPDPMRDFMLHLDEIMKPLKDQISVLQAEFQRMTTQAADYQSLKSKVEELTAEIGALRLENSRLAGVEAEVQKLKENMPDLGAFFHESTVIHSAKSAGKTRLIDLNDLSSIPILATPLPSTSTPFRAGSPAQPTPSHPGPSTSLLGKRTRKLTGDGVAGDAEEGEVEEERPPKARRTSRKRTKPSSKQRGGSRSSRQGSSGPSDGDEDVVAPVAKPPNAPAFTIFSGPEEPPETNSNPSHRAGGSSNQAGPSEGINIPIRRTANAIENNQGGGNANAGFNFSFSTALYNPVIATPAPSFNPLAFSYPEPPTSPIPRINTIPSGGYVERAGGRIERNDLFHPHGPPRRPRSGASDRPSSRGDLPTGDSSSSARARTPPSTAVPERLAEPSHGMGSPPISSTALGQQLGMSALPLPPETPGQPVKRTMYGTELEADTRFGDFGVEGVATGFWTGTAPPRF
ncbi:hypothetical protein WOLCODRAFT_135171 [Wolfiporia cocos MD-104 SS10]|uniref:Uncharacterized protein n=1 Tax=Wolfiporia cocos (strain MD-104) TaxID=742152 RepID=A0A2H3IU79_WOLCO|nr:hypothetical protein WOLCODRAFT_135171 [Wolfiporia cocos MD-104 SS10]